MYTYLASEKKKSISRKENKMRVQVAAALLAATQAAAQSVVGTAYGFAKGVTGGADGETVTASTPDELAKLLSDDTARTVVIDKEFDFTGTKATGAGCDRKSCSANNGGQLYLGDLSCGGADNVAVSSISYDAAGTKPLAVGSNKSILGLGKGKLVGKGLELQSGASNVIIQGLEITNANPGVVWGGDLLALKASGSITTSSASPAGCSSSHTTTLRASPFPTTSSTARRPPPPAATTTTTGP